MEEIVAQQKERVSLREREGYACLRGKAAEGGEA